MGVVYEAIDSTIDRRVAIKILRQDLLEQNPELISRLWIEARAANGIHHQGVVQISEAAVTDDGVGYLVMELLDGQTLTQRLQQSSGRLSVPSAIQIGVQLASTLAAAHSKGIIHRDLKPDNVMLILDDAAIAGERVKILDFGIAKLQLAMGSEAKLTQAGSTLGTPGYMAPEQLRDAGDASEKSDVYGLGAVLYHLLAGRPPHTASSVAELIATALRDPPPLLGTVAPHVPTELQVLIHQMLHAEPLSERPSMADVLRSLVLFGARRSGPWVERRVPIGETMQEPESPIPETQVGTQGKRPIVSAIDAHDAAALSPGTSEPSASTLSQSGGQRTAAFRQQTKYLSVVFVGLMAIGLWMWLRAMPERESSPKTAGSSQRLMTQSDLAIPQYSSLPDLLVLPFSFDLSAKDRILANAEGSDSDRASTADPGPSSRFPDPNCVRSPGHRLPPRLSKAIAWAFRRADIQLATGESFVLIRQGKHLVPFDPPAKANRQMDALRELLSADRDAEEFPEHIHNIEVRCLAEP